MENVMSPPSRDSDASLGDVALRGFLAGVRTHEELERRVVRAVADKPHLSRGAFDSDLSADGRQRKQVVAELSSSKKTKKKATLTGVQRRVTGCRPGSPELASALVARSRLLVGLSARLGHDRKTDVLVDYRLVLRDLETAEEAFSTEAASSSAQELHELHYLKAFCQIRLNLFGDAAVSLDEAGKWLGEAAACVDKDKFEALKAKLLKGRQTVSAAGGKNGSPPELARPETPRLQSRNEKYPALSSSVMVSNFPGEGRGVVATRTIRPGELVCVDSSPLAASSISESLLTRCHHCLKRTYNLLPCPDCPDALFCSADCASAAASSYHRYECRCLVACWKRPEMSALLRFLFSRPLTEHERSAREAREAKKDASPADADVDRDAAFWMLYRPKGELPADPASLVENLFRVVSDAWELARVSGYLTNQESEDVVSTLELILSIFQIQKTNQCLLTGLDSEGDLFLAAADPAPTSIPDDHTGFGQATFSAAALFNHSCMRNAAAVCVGPSATTQLIFATEVIRAGQQIHISYGPNVAMPLEYRKAQLRFSRDFVCACFACSSGVGAVFGPQADPAAEHGSTLDRVIDERDRLGMTEATERYLQARDPAGALDYLSGVLEKVQGGEGKWAKESELARRLFAIITATVGVIVAVNMRYSMAVEKARPK